MGSHGVPSLGLKVNKPKIIRSKSLSVILKGRNHIFEYREGHEYDNGIQIRSDFKNLALATRLPVPILSGESVHDSLQVLILELRQFADALKNTND